MVIGEPHHHFETIGSTNAEARRLAIGDSPSGTLVTSEEQTDGRGRQGRAWATPAGKALAYSVIVRREIEIPGLFPLRAGLAVCEAVEREGVERAEIKWPNDVMVGGRKCAGILVEARPQDGWAVIGIGVNLSITPDEFPPEFRDRATSVGGSATISTMTVALNDSLATWLDAEPDRVLDEVASRDFLRDRAIAWDAGSGVAFGIAPDGRLRVETPEGEVLLDAGEVHLDAG
jgi:BirA family biotin operon repressor/biotin-[acetyl-CoA-carboxylase] ligase